ncbi:MAG: rod shape-determining protein MreC [Gammaproteobacteria bacterium]|nr:rod shape-determining protein MreC [Gammaproteobacteria bacterium]
MALGTTDSKQRGYRETTPGLRAVAICALAIGLMVADSRSELLVDLRRLLAASAYPVQVLIDSPVAFGRWVRENMVTRRQLLEENRMLRQRVLARDGRLQTMASLEQENARLRALLDSTAKVSDRVLIAEIMAVDMNPFRHQIIVNKGSDDDVFVGQALIDADGVVGQVTRDQVFSAEAILITDVEHALPVEVLRNRQRTIAVGTGQLDELSLPFLPRNADIVPGDLLVTSGLGGTFPAGYPVATVSAVTNETGASFLTVTAQPAARLSRVREVLLIWPGEQTAPIVAEPAPSERERINTAATDQPANGAIE